MCCCKPPVCPFLPGSGAVWLRTLFLWVVFAVLTLQGVNWAACVCGERVPCPVPQREPSQLFSCRAGEGHKIPPHPRPHLKQKVPVPSAEARCLSRGCERNGALGMQSCSAAFGSPDSLWKGKSLLFTLCFCFGYLVDLCTHLPLWSLLRWLYRCPTPSVERSVSIGTELVPKQMSAGMWKGRSS